MRSKERLIIVANRLPVHRGKGKASGQWVSSAGGLVTALKPVLRARGGGWIGWTGSNERNLRPFVHDDVRMLPVSLSRAEVEGFYENFSNRTLWPLFHDAIRSPDFDHSWWRPYLEVNRRYARRAAEGAARGATVWVHDYHLMLVPGMLRSQRPDLRIGFFLHIPFPPEELFAWLPWRRDLIEGVLGADVVGFQSEGGARNFARAAAQFAGARGARESVHWQGRHVHVRAFPISIDFGSFDRDARSGSVARRAAQIRERVGKERRILLGVDRLDYTKGIDARLRAFESMLEQGGFGVDDCVLIQVAVPSRDRISEYARERAAVEQIVGRINGTYGQAGRVAAHYLRRSLSRVELLALYRSADVMLVTPLRDGMNLVAKEYVATRFDNTGVLVLSEFAGAAGELKRAMLVNPRDIEGMATVFAESLRLTGADATRRMTALRRVVRHHDLDRWAKEFLGALAS